MTRRKPTFAGRVRRGGDEIDRNVIQRWREAIRGSTAGHFHHQMGVALQAAGHRDAASAAFVQAMEACPGRYSSAARLIHLLEEDGDSARAATVIADMGLPEQLAQKLVEEAEDVLADGMADDAVALMAHALAIGERVAVRWPDFVVRLAGEIRDRHEQALHWCDLAAPYAQDRYALHHQKGFSLLLLDRQEEARRELLASLALAPEQMPSWYVLGQYHRLRFETAAAIPLYQRVWRSDHPLRRWGGLMIAYTFLLAGRYAEALDACDAVREWEPRMHWATVIRGLVHFRSGDLDAADRAFDVAQPYDPDLARACVFRGMLKLARNQPREALAELDGRRGDFACLAVARLGRARALLDLGELEEAERLVRVAVAEEGQWIHATLRILGPLGDALAPFLASAGHAAKRVE